MEDYYLRSLLRFFFLFNPFLMSIDLLKLIHGLSMSILVSVRSRASFISSSVFPLMATLALYMIVTGTQATGFAQ